MKTAFIDLETFSETPIQDGTWKYSEKAEVMIFAYAIDDEPVQAWDVTAGTPMPADLKKALDDPKVLICGHNIGGFDRVILQEAFMLPIPIERVHDTMAQAYAHGLPGSLDVLCDIMQVPVSKAKDKDGKKLIQLFCKPRKDGTRATSKTHEIEWARFIAYAKLDIEATRYIYGKMPKWNYQGFELDLWRLDQKINFRGLTVDTDLAHAAITAVKRAQDKLAARTDDLTLGDLKSTTQRDETLRHILEAYGVTLPDLTMSTVERRMEDPDLPPELKELLGIRLQASSTSTAKYGKLIKGVSSDGRLRGTLQFCGASRTGRWGGRLFQIQNLIRSYLPQETIEFGIEAIKNDCADLFFDNVMEITSNAIRGCICAPPGKKLVVSDLASIEGRVLPWLAGEQWELDAYAAYDAGRGFDNYILTYAKAFNVDPQSIGKKDPRRQIGKVMLLMLGFGGSVGAFITGAASYKIDLKAMAAGLIHNLPAFAREKAEGSWEWAIKEKRTYDLERDVYIVCRALTEMWRNNHPKTVAFWNNLQNCVIEAIDKKGAEFTTNSGVSAIRVRRDGSWLRLILPSGRSLCYPAPRYDNDEISFMGMDQYSRQWRRIKTYAGKLSENVTQAVARDVMASSMPLIEKAGYSIVASIHDEIITEAPDNDNFDEKKLSAILAAQPSWAPGLPLAASGFSAYRYKKE